MNHSAKYRRELDRASRCVAGDHDPSLGIVRPIQTSTAYYYLEEGPQPYPRYFNTPNQDAIANRIAELENAEAGIVFCSGMAAISTCVMSLVSPGDHVLLLRGLRQRIEKASLADRVEVKNMDMAALDFPTNMFDLIWSEGAAYIMGVREALKAWRPFLRNQGYLAFTELVWLDDRPPAEVAEFFGREYPAMTRVQAINEALSESGYENMGDFTLPDSAWWDDYYTPLNAKLPALKQKYAGDEQALAVIASSEAEIEMRRRFGESYGYQFFVARKVDRQNG